MPDSATAEPACRLAEPTTRSGVKLVVPLPCAAKLPPDWMVSAPVIVPVPDSTPAGRPRPALAPATVTLALSWSPAASVIGPVTAEK